MNSARRYSLFTLGLGVVLPLIGFGLLVLTRRAAIDAAVPRAGGWIPLRMAAAMIHIGAIEVVVGIAVLGVIVLKRMSRLVDAGFLTFVLLGATIGNLLVKMAISAPHPPSWDRARGFAFGFPSGMAMSTAAVAAAIVVLTWGTRWQWAAFSLGLIYVVFIGLSLAQSGECTPAAVLGGWELAVAWVMTVEYVRERLNQAVSRATGVTERNGRSDGSDK